MGETVADIAFASNVASAARRLSGDVVVASIYAGGVVVCKEAYWFLASFRGMMMMMQDSWRKG